MPFSSRETQESTPAARGYAALGAFSVALVLVWVVLIAYCVHPALPYNPISLPGARSVNRLVLAPQGWAFFTRNPREERLFVYSRGPNGWKAAMKGPHARFRNKLGLDRSSRAQGVEIAMLMNTAPAAAWRACENAVGECLRTPGRGTGVRNPSLNPTLCGPVAIVQQQPVPWAWSSSPNPVQMPSRILRLEASC